MSDRPLSFAELDGASLPVLAGWLHSPTNAHRSDAACTLGDRLRTRELVGLDGAVRVTLITLLADPDPGVRFEAAIALAEARENAAFGVLLAACGKRDLRLDAVRALGALGDPRAVAPLWAIMHRWWFPWADRLQAAAALCALRDVRGESYLRCCLDSRRKAERAAAIHFLGEAKHPQACTLLLGIVRNVLDPMRDAAVRALGLLGDASAVVPLKELLPNAEGDMAEDLRDTCSSSRPQAPPRPLHTPDFKILNEARLLVPLHAIDRAGGGPR